MVFFSVIIPVYNRPSLVLRAIESVQQQTYSNFECLIVEDGSCDPIPESNLNSLLLNKRFSYHFMKKNRGVSTARNHGIAQAKGEWICFLDADDTWDKKKLELCERFLIQFPHYLIFQTEDIWIRKEKRVNPRHKHLKVEGDLFEKSLALCSISPSSVCVNKKLFYTTEGVGGFDKKLRCCEDYALWLKITSLHPIGLLKKKLTTRYQGNDDQLSFLYPVMDRFRIYALYKFILSSHDKLHIDLAKKMMNKKINIVLEGAKKRKRYFFFLRFFLKYRVYFYWMLLCRRSLKFFTLKLSKKKNICGKRVKR